VANSTFRLLRVSVVRLTISKSRQPSAIVQRWLAHSRAYPAKCQTGGCQHTPRRTPDQRSLSWNKWPAPFGTHPQPQLGQQRPYRSIGQRC
jgi:hypothetical protein